MTSVKRGDRFGKWIVIGEEPCRKGNGKKLCRHWLCRCDCGTEKHVEQGSLLYGLSHRCKKCRSRAIATKHGLQGTKEYKAWQGMKKRCNNPKDSAYHNYGGRGIRVCDRWQNSFEAFYQDMGPSPSPDRSLERIDNDGNYRPGNCTWATRLSQSNNKRTNRFVTVNGKTKTMTQWARYTGISVQTIHCRLSHGWSDEDAVTRPARKKRRSQHKGDS